MTDRSPTSKPARPAKPVAVQSAAEGPGGNERIAKAMARAGLCSRRDAERWIGEGRVAVNGKVLDSPAFKVGPEDRISVDGRPVAKPEGTRLWRYHKPSGLVTTHRDPAGRETVFAHLPEDLPRVISVGRLDLTSEGLLLLTNDGELARRLELPATAWVRRYRVRAFGRVSQEDLLPLAEGIVVDGIAYGPVEAVLERAETANAWLTVSLREGKNREVRRVLEAIGLKVNRLIRVSYGPFQLGNLPAGVVEEVPPRALREMVGKLMPAPPPRWDPAPEPVKPARGANLSAPRKTPKAGAGKADGDAVSKPGRGKPPGAGKTTPRSAKHRPSLLDEGRAAKAGKPGPKPGRKQRDGAPAKAQGAATRPGGRSTMRTQPSTKPTKPRT